MRRVLALVVAAAALLVAAPAHAIETAAFGVEPSPKTTAAGNRTSYRIEVRPGSETTDAMRVWNKTDRALTLKLSAISASVDGSGKVALGGTAGVASWFSFEPAQVELGPKASQVVRFTVHAPKSLDGSDVAAAVTVEPVQSGSGGVAVVQRLATMVYVSTVAGEVSGGIDWKLIALAVLSVISIAGAFVAWTRPRRRASEYEEQEEEEEEEEVPSRSAPGDEEEANVFDEAREDEMEVGGIYVSVNDPAVDDLIGAMYEPPRRQSARPTLELVHSEPKAEASEEFAWSVPSRKR